MAIVRTDLRGIYQLLRILFAILSDLIASLVNNEESRNYSITEKDGGHSFTEEFSICCGSGDNKIM